MGQPVVHFEIGCRDSQKTQGFYSSLFGWKIAQEGPAAMIETGKGNTGHITALGHEPYHYTIFLRGNGRRAGISRQSSFTGRKNSRGSGANSHRHVCVDAGSGRKRGRPLETRHKLNTTRTANSKKGAYLPLLQKEVLPRRQYPYSSRKPIWNPQSYAARSKMPAAPIPPPTHMVTKP